MPNSYFRFKEFTIQQDQCAMKVCTDSCLFGAWVANELKYKAEERIDILDIGAGTGLLSLILAQQLSSATIDAVEIEEACFKQAEANISHTTWKERVHIYNADINLFFSQKKYDIIISNPPFYEWDLVADNVAKNIAHHNAGLTLGQLLHAVKEWLKDDGCFAVILPYHRSTWFENLAKEDGFFVNKRVRIKQTSKHSFFRTFLLFSKERRPVFEDEIVIKDSDNQYTDKFISLLRDYYLYL